MIIDKVFKVCCQCFGTNYGKINGKCTNCGKYYAKVLTNVV